MIQIVVFLKDLVSNASTSKLCVLLHCLYNDKEKAIINRENFEEVLAIASPSQKLHLIVFFFRYNKCIQDITPPMYFKVKTICTFYHFTYGFLTLYNHSHGLYQLLHKHAIQCQIDSIS